MLLVPTLLLMSAAAVSAWAATSPTKISQYLHRSLHGFGDDRYVAAETDLNGDGRAEIVVYVTDPGYCGSGGCLTLVLEPDGRTYRIVMRATVSWPPIRVLSTRSHGWRDLGVMVAGGGIHQHEARMRFDGRRYPSNPTVPPAIPMKREAGQVLISEEAVE
jgi:hypothetical protein